MNSVVTQVKPLASTSVLVRMATKYGIDNEKMLATLKATAFKGDVSTEQMMALCVVAEQYGLNPWTKEIYAFPAQGGIVPVVGVDGWSRIINSNPQFDGMDFNEGAVDAAGIPEWIECVIHRKDRAHPIKVKEYFAEVNRPTMGPWKSHPRRMLRHKAMIQSARLAFGFVGIFDEDEAARIVELPTGDGSGRPDTNHIPPEEIERHLCAIRSIMDNEEDKYADEYKQAEALRDYDQTYLSPFPELYTAVFDSLAKQKIITKAKFREWLKLLPPRE